jgi:hypothetical protein
MTGYEIPITTGLELPGRTVRQNLGITFGLRFDSSEMGQQLTEVVAYGTAVVLDGE